MRSIMRPLALLVLIALLAGTRPAYAYIDPGSSSMLLQMIAGGVAAAVVVTRRFWSATVRRLSRFGRRSRGPGRNVTPHGESGK
jgi:hypothetical protein